MHPLRVRLLGEFRLEGADLAQLKSRQARTVLKRLAVAEGATLSADTLAEAVWGTDPPADPARDLYVLVSRARAVVSSNRIPRREAGYALLADSWDRADLVALTRDAARRQDGGDLAGAATAAEAALALVSGPLLADGPESDWVLTERAAVRSVIAEARSVAARAALTTGRLGDAVSHSRAAIEQDPYDEAAARILLQAQTAAGRPASALADYAALRRRLRDDLGVDPAPATAELYQQILRGDRLQRPSTSTGWGTGPSDRLVGREGALRTLDEALATAQRSVGTVLVTGEPGIGKTALLDRWTVRARARGVTTLEARAEPGSLSLQPVLDALASRLSSVSELDAVLAEVPVQSASAAALTRQIFGRIDAALADLAATQRGLALVLDDAQQADELTWRWLSHVTRRRFEQRVLVILALPGVSALPPGGVASDVATRSTSIRRLPLSPLDRDAVAQLVDADRVDDLLRRSGGNALLLTELARARPGDEVPATVRETAAARLRHCGAAVPTLQAAALLGPTIDLDLLAGVLDTSPVVLLDHLDVGVRHFFLVDRLGTLAFRHELVRLAVAADAGAARQVWLNRRAAALLRQRAGSSPVRIAGHARAGGDLALAAEALAQAADLAASRGDLEAAQHHLDEALRCEKSSGLRLHRSRIRMARGDVEGADADAQAAMAEDRTGAALELRTWAARNRHDLSTAIRLGTAAAAAATTPEIKASSLIALAFAHRGTGDLAAADRVLGEATAIEGAGDLGLPAWIGVLRVHQGRPNEALANLEPVLGSEAAGGRQAFWVEHTLQMTAHAYGLIGRPTDALRLLDRLDIALERRGTVSRYGGTVHTYRSWVLRNLGAAEEAVELAWAGLELAATAEIRGQCHLDVSDSLLRAGRLDDTAGHLDLAQAEAEQRWFHNKWRFDQRLGTLRARLALAAGDPAQAIDHADAVVTAATRGGDRRYQVLGRLLRETAEARHRPGPVRPDPARSDRLDSDLALLGEVAALEGWWIAADVAEATGSDSARRTAAQLASRLVLASGDRADQLRAAVASRLG